MSFFNVFENNCTLHGIQGHQLTRILLSLLNEKANEIYSGLDIDTCRSYDSVKTEIFRRLRLSPKASLQKFRTMRHYGDDSYSQLLHKLKDVQNYYLESKQITEFQSLCDDMLLEQFRSVWASEVGVFVDQRNVSSATKVAKLADLFYESNRDGNAKIDAIKNFNSRGNQPFNLKNFSMPNVNSEPSKNGVNAVIGHKKPYLVAQEPMAPQIRCFYCKMPNHTDLNVPNCSQGRTIVQELG